MLRSAPFLARPMPKFKVTSCFMRNRFQKLRLFVAFTMPSSHYFYPFTMRHFLISMNRFINLYEDRLTLDLD